MEVELGNVEVRWLCSAISWGGGTGFDSFWARFQVVAVLQKWDTGEKRMAKLPLFLDGEALTVYNEMSALDSVGS